MRKPATSFLAYPFKIRYSGRHPPSAWCWATMNRLFGTCQRAPDKWFAWFARAIERLADLSGTLPPTMIPRWRWYRKFNYQAVSR